MLLLTTTTSLLLLLCTVHAEQVHRECRTSKNGQEYQGTLAESISKKQCLPWAGSGVPEHWRVTGNLCRNPDNDNDGPWCLLEGDPPDEKCPVVICDVSDDINDVYRDQLYISQNKTSSDAIADNLMLIFPPIIIVLGTMCNAFSVALFYRKLKDNSSRHNTVFLFMTLAICDTLSLNIGAWREWLNAIFRKEQINITLGASSDLSCRMYFYIYSIITTFSVWVLVLITLERATSVVFPMKVHEYSKRKYSWRVLVIILILVSLIYIPVPMYYKQRSYVRYAGTETDVFSQCTPSNVKMDILLDWLDSGARILVPFGIMLTSNLVIIGTLAHRNRNAAIASSSGAKIDLTHLTTMLLCASFAHLILTVPSLILFVRGPILNIIDKETYIVWKSVVLCFVYVDYSVNFVLYCLSGRKIRLEFYAMMGCGKNKYSPANIQMKHNVNSSTTGGTENTYMSRSSMNGRASVMSSKTGATGKTYMPLSMNGGTSV